MIVFRWKTSPDITTVRTDSGDRNKGVMRRMCVSGCDGVTAVLLGF